LTITAASLRIPALQAVLDDRLVGRNLFKKQLPGIRPREESVEQDGGVPVVKQQC
jgi:hypothetical protein